MYKLAKNRILFIKGKAVSIVSLVLVLACIFVGCGTDIPESGGLDFVAPPPTVDGDIIFPDAPSPDTDDGTESPDIDTDEDGNTTPEPESEPESEPEPIPTPSEPQALLDYSLDILYNGAGYLSAMEQYMNIKTDLGFFGSVDSSQYIKTDKAYSNGIYRERTWTTGEANYYRHFYFDLAKSGKNVDYVYTSNSNYYDYNNKTVDLDNLSATSMTQQEVYDLTAVMPIFFVFDMAKENLSSISATAMDNGNYMVTASFKKENIPEYYLDQIYKGSTIIQSNSVSFKNDLVFNIEINSTNGHIVKYTKEESYDAKVKILLTFDTTITPTYTETFHYMDTSMTLANPLPSVA